MKIAARLTLLIIYCAAAAFAVGCSGVDDPGRSPDVLDGDQKQDPDFVATLAIKDATGEFRDSFSPGEQIVFELSVTNRRNRPLTVTRGSSQVFDFFVAPAGTRQVLWRWSADKVFLTVIETDEFAPGETKTYSVTWDQDRDDGLSLPSGEYIARGIYAALNADLAENLFRHSEFASALLPFVIQ